MSFAVTGSGGTTVSIESKTVKDKEVVCAKEGSWMQHRGNLSVYDGVANVHLEDLLW